jgi:type IV pilus assembly protein PilY1
MNTPHDFPGRLRTPALQLLIASLVWAPGVPVMAAPAQMPLLNKPAESVDPNVFYTIDDSGSMAWSALPDERVNFLRSRESLPNRLVRTTFPVNHPNEPDKNKQDNFTCVVPTHSGRGSSTWLTTSSAPHHVNFRMPNVTNARPHPGNELYYNPNIRYRPWMKSDGTEFANSTPGTTSASTLDVYVDPLQLVKPSSATSAATAFLKPREVTPLSPLSSSSPTTGWCAEATLGYDRNGVPFLTPNLVTYETRYFSPASYFEAGYGWVDIGGAASTATFPPNRNKAADRTDCASGTKCTQAEELANFANWFTYYRTRNLLAIGASSRAFAPQKFNMRLGYGRINNTTANSQYNAIGTLIRGVRPFSDPLKVTDRQEFFDWLYGVPALGGTPLRRALDDVGQYFMNRTDNGPWADDPKPLSTSTANTNHLACRKSFHLLMTDGYWNSEQATTAAARADVDSTTGPKHTSDMAMRSNPNQVRTYTYTPANSPRYQDKWANTLADVAMYYWVNDLRPDLRNKVPLPSSIPTDTATEIQKADENALDHAFWQHLNTYTVSLGVQGTLPASVTDSPGSSGITLWPANNVWPKPENDSYVNGGDEKMVDDLFHAARNGRGRFLTTRNPADFEAAIKSFLQSVAASVPTDSGVAVSGIVLDSDSRSYIPSYNPSSWFGDIIAYNIGSAGTGTTVAWKASEAVRPASARNIITWNPETRTATTFGVDGAGLSTAMRSALVGTRATTEANKLINYLRGDRSEEGSQLPALRCRGTTGDAPCQAPFSATAAAPLGDIVNSTPLLVRDALDLNYQFLPDKINGKASGNTTYREYMTSKSKRAQGLLFAGANDGMLHAFTDPKTGQSDEVLAYVPSSVLGNMARLADLEYGKSTDPSKAHRFYVDGPLVESDAYLNGAWQNMVLGSTGAGARTVFALRVNTTSPAQMSVTNLMWELSATSSTAASNDLAKLGYVTQPVATGVTRSGQWVAVFGNGPDSTHTDGAKAYLFVVDLATGNLITTLKASDDLRNGLGGVSLITDINRTIVGAYAGDLKGKMWRFDMESANPSDWRVGLGGKPLFTASTPQPITAAPTYLSHPKGGLLVVFGTGKLYSDTDDTNTPENENDPANTSLQTLFAVRDRTKVGGSSLATVQPVQSKLLRREFEIISGSTDTWTIRKVPAVDLTQDGWYLDLEIPVSGSTSLPRPRALFSPQLLPDALIMGAVDLKQEDRCDSASATSYILVLDPLTGGTIVLNSTDANSTKTIVSAYKRPFRGNPKVTYSRKPGGGEGVVISGGGNCPTCTGGSNTIDVTLPSNFVRRNWRQIINFPQ